MDHQKKKERMQQIITTTLKMNFGSEKWVEHCGSTVALVLQTQTYHFVIFHTRVRLQIVRFIEKVLNSMKALWTSSKSEFRKKKKEMKTLRNWSINIKYAWWMAYNNNNYIVFRIQLCFSFTARLMFVGPTSSHVW